MDVAARRLSSIPAAIAFGGPIGLSAFLLFTSEPMVARLAQPVFGGAAAVWATVLVFFQVVLLLGYAYAHLVATRLSPVRGATLHIVLAMVAGVLTITSPRVVADLVSPALPVIPNVLLVLATIVGPATFVMAATTPLVSTWFARERPSRDPGGSEGDPYWLYALSNFGSLVSLLAYPLLVQPAIGLTSQRLIWTGGYFVLLALLVGAAVRSVGRQTETQGTDASPVAEATAVAEAAPAIGRARRLRWILLSAIPSGLLAATTNLVTTDLVSAPLLWILPLAIYLATFVVAFSERGRRILPAVTLLAPAALTLLWVPLGSTAGWPILPLLLIEYAGLAVVALALHGRLAEDRPPAAGITGFYLTMSLGGALGGAFVGILAPTLFDGIWEYPILVAATAAALVLGRPGGVAETARRPFGAFFSGWMPRLVPFAVVSAGLLIVMTVQASSALESATRWLLVGALILLVGGPPRFFALSTAVVLVLATFVLPPSAVFRDRSFFGVTEVRRSADATMTVLMHGTTAHGVQWSDAVHRDDPGSYYSRGGPVGDLFAVLEDRPPLSIRVVGLGAGVLASYGRPGDDLVFYEIDSLVAHVASAPSLFTFLRDAKAATSVRIGDGRLLVAEDPPRSLDLVVMDAFTSDAVPTHLITTEAMADVERVLGPGGLVAVHVSNRYYELGPAVASAMREAGLEPLQSSWRPTAAEMDRGATFADWLVAGRPGEADAALAALEERGWSTPTAGEPLTDDFADLLRLLLPASG